MTFVDSNIPMYIVGADHPNRTTARHLLERCVAEGERLVTDVEVLQEILHRYSAIKRRDAIQPAFDAVLGVVDEVLGVGVPEIQRAKELVLGTALLSARDAVHVAVMEANGIERILTFDTAFATVPGITVVA